jgi:uncharacterized protein YxjI
MHQALNENLFLVKEHIGMFKAANNYDVYNPTSGEMTLHCREPQLGFVTKLLRFTDYKRMTPFDIQITDPQGNSVLRIKRGVSIFLSKIQVFDANNVHIGGFKQKFSFRSKFQVLSANDDPICTLKGNLIGWDFRFLAGDNGAELAHVTKKWGGLGKEFFTSADNYVLEIFDTVPQDQPLRQLILAAVMCIDMVLKE